MYDFALLQVFSKIFTENNTTLLHDSPNGRNLANIRWRNFAKNIKP